MRQHIAEGKLPTRLALGWQGRVGFVLTQALQLKKIAFQEGVFEQPGASKGEDRFDADVALATGELSGMIVDLIEALGGEVDASAAAGAAPASAPAAAADAGAAARHAARAEPVTAGTDDEDGPPF